MIAKSDFVILLVTLTTLGGGVYRWQFNKGSVPAVTVPASLQAGGVRTVDNSNPVAQVTGKVEQPTVDATSPRIVNADDEPANGLISAKSNETATLVLPGADVNSAEDTNSEAASNEPLYGVYTVKSGDYLGKIANRYQTSVRELREVNNLSGSNILVGQQLRYPLPAN